MEEEGYNSRMESMGQLGLVVGVLGSSCNLVEDNMCHQLYHLVVVVRHNCMRAEMVEVESNRLSLSLVLVVVDNWKSKMMVLVVVEMVVVVIVLVVEVMELGHMGCHMLSTLCMRSGTWKWLLLVLLLWLGLQL